MAKVNPKSAFKSNGAPTLYTLRKVLGMKARAAGAVAKCIGRALKGRSFPAPPGQGGRRNKALQQAFRSAAASCRGSSGGE